MATISSFRTALAAPDRYFTRLSRMTILDGQILRSTYFAETKVECEGRRMFVYMPLSGVSLRRVERFIPLKRDLVESVVPRLTILREEMRVMDSLGRATMCDILCEPMPEGLPFADAVASIASEQEAANLMEALAELQLRLQRADISHNNINEDNIYINNNCRLSLVRWYYATAGVGGDERAFTALRERIISMCNVATLREPDTDSYDVIPTLEGHLSVRYMHEGLAAVEDATGWGFVDSDNRIVVEPKYEWVSDFREGRAEVQCAEGMGLIDKSGEYVIPPRYKIVEYDEVSGTSQAYGAEGWVTFDYDGHLLEELESDMPIYPPPIGCEIY